MTVYILRGPKVRVFSSCKYDTFLEDIVSNELDFFYNEDGNLVFITYLKLGDDPDPTEIYKSMANNIFKKETTWWVGDSLTESIVFTKNRFKG